MTTNIKLLANEEDTKLKIVVETLRDLGFNADELTYEASFSLKLGKHWYKVDTEEQLKRGPVAYADIRVIRDGRPLLMIEVKRDGHELTPDDAEQGVSYARLTTPITPVVMVTNGKDTKFYDAITTGELDPTAVRDASGKTPTGDPSLLYEALASFIGYSKDNLLAFCHEQANARMRELVGSAGDLSRKYVPELYVPPRREVEALGLFRQANQRVAAITGPAGAGKTCLICHDARARVDEGLPVLFFRAGDVSDGLVSAIGEDLNWSLSPDLPEDAAVRRLLHALQDRDLTIYVDGLDEIGVDRARRVTAEFVDRLSNHARLVFSCKSTRWSALIRDETDVPTPLARSLFHFDGEDNLSVAEMPRLDLFEAADRYSAVYGVRPRLTDDVLRDAQRNPALLKLIFEVCRDTGERGFAYTSRQFFEAYLAMVLRRFGERRDSGEALLCTVAKMAVESDGANPSVQDVVSEMRGLAVDDLLRCAEDAGVLLRDARLIGFALPQVRDYTYVFWVEQLIERGPDEWCQLARDAADGGSRRDVLNMLFDLGGDTVQSALLGDDCERLRELATIVDDVRLRAFPSLAGRRGSHLGVIAYADPAARAATAVAVRERQETEPPLVAVARSRAVLDDHRAFVLGARTLHAWPSGRIPWGDGVAAIAFSSLLRNALNDLVESAVLNEDGSNDLLCEKLVGLSDGLFRDLPGVTGCVPPGAYRSVALDDIEARLLYLRGYRVAVDEARRADQSVNMQRAGNMAWHVFHLTGEVAAQAQARAERCVETREWIEGPPHEDEDHALAEAHRIVGLLRKRGLSETGPGALPSPDGTGRRYRIDLFWTPETLRKLCEDVVRRALLGYVAVVEGNFGEVVRPHLFLYSHLPFTAIVVAEAHGSHGELDIFYGKGAETELTVRGVEADELDVDLDAQRFTFGGRTYEMFSKSGAVLSPTLYPSERLGRRVKPELSVLRSWVYRKVKSELRSAMPKIAAEFGAPERYL